MKDTVDVTRISSLEIDFVADDPVPAPALPSPRQRIGLHGLITYLYSTAEDTY